MNEAKAYKSSESKRLSALKWAKSNRQRASDNKRKYFEKHRERLTALEVESRKRRRTNSLNVKLADMLRNRMNMAVKIHCKSGSAVQDLGCSIAEFKTHIESKFQVGMTWDNWSKNGWHLDHIIPLSSFDLSNPEQFKKAAHFSNLQPLWARDNLSKGASYVAPRAQ